MEANINQGDLVGLFGVYCIDPGFILCTGQQSQAQNSGPDYSKAWEEYYKKQSKTTPTWPLHSSNILVF